jgi:uncharacterized protein YjbI with pentapeptide repeats
VANPEHLALLKNGVEAWNRWREHHATVAIDLTNADLSGMRLDRADLSLANLSRAHFEETDLNDADLTLANLSGAQFRAAELMAADLSSANLSGARLHAYLIKANFHQANLTGADLTDTVAGGANFSEANLSKADLSGADLQECIFVKTNLCGANLTGALIYGISVWDVHLEDTIQRDLVISEQIEEVGTITTDDLEMAQFLNLLLNNQRIRKVIDTITSKVVLILGRFTPERKAILDALREELRRRDYLPVMFDFEKPDHRDVTETVATLAHMARFVLADLTNAKSIPQELGRIVPFLPSVPVQPILLASEREWGMYETFPRYPWVLPIARYESQEALLANLQSEIIDPAENKAREQTNYQKASIRS